MQSPIEQDSDDNVLHTLEDANSIYIQINNSIHKYS